MTHARVRLYRALCGAVARSRNKEVDKHPDGGFDPAKGRRDFGLKNAALRSADSCCPIGYRDAGCRLAGPRDKRR